MQKVNNNYEEKGKELIYSQKDKDFINRKWFVKWDDFRVDWDKWEKHTLADYIKDFAELIALKIDAGILDIKKTEISPYLWQKFLDDEKHISDRYIRDVLPDDYKRNYSTSELSAELDDHWDIILENESFKLEINPQNIYRVNGQELKIIESRKPTELKLEIPKEKLNDTTKSIFALEQCGSLLERIAHYMKDNYIENKEILDKAFKDKSLFYLDHYAMLTNARKEIDERNKWGDYEKIMSKFLIDTGQSTAHIAELLNYSSKYGSIGIDRHGEFVDPQTKEFKRELLEFLMRCPNCKNNIYHIINENIELYRKDKELKIELPL